MAWNVGADGHSAAHVVAVCNLKGGTGKSTLSVNIACALATRGLNVALVDNDEQASAALWASAGNLPVSCRRLPLARLEDARPWLQVLLGLRARHDVVLLDFPAGLPPGLWPTILMASLVLVPTSPNEIEIAATRRMLQRIAVLRAARASDPPSLLIVPNRVLGDELGPQGFGERLAVLGEPLAPPARFRPEHDEAFAERQWIGAARPGSPAHQDIEALAEHIHCELVPRAPGCWPPDLTAADRQVEPGQEFEQRMASAPASALPILPAGGGPPPSPKVVFVDERTASQLRRMREDRGLRGWAMRLIASLPADVSRRHGRSPPCLRFPRPLGRIGSMGFIRSVPPHPAERR